jgi:hypothetical protein
VSIPEDLSYFLRELLCKPRRSYVCLVGRYDEGLNRLLCGRKRLYERTRISWESSGVRWVRGSEEGEDRQ